MIPSCREMTEIVTDYVEGRLSPFERLRFELHLGLCRGCRAYLRQMRLTARALGRLSAPPLTREVEAEFLRRFASFTPKRS